ncbi:MAG: hypothetical protein A3F11_01475 [Gammaproteobacteria bacterium RIFCSPHIGHO2_12_FULL_37_14]|nr:MAG: hypothetical protein A3F11_01475 [Gammaproteobacteria bacterium RIFCSPHIGHO2_12_FULL_37_14]
MGNKEVMIVVNYTENAFSLDELCEACQISPNFIGDLIEYEIICPEGETPEEWVFDMIQLQRVKTVLRLQHDLEVNLAGAAVVLDLMDELERLRAKAELLERYILK